MASGPRQRRATLWAWVYAVLFGPSDEGGDDQGDEESTETDAERYAQ